MQSYMIGWGHTPLGRLNGQDSEDLLVAATREALDDAGVSAGEIDAIFVGHFNNGMSAQDFTASLALQADEAFRFKPATRLENACATGSAAIHAGLDFLAAGRGRRVLVVGVEKMTDSPAPQVADSLLAASYRREESGIQGGFVGVFAHIADQYFGRFGDQREILARIAAKNHQNGVDNPYAQLRKDLGFEFCNTVSDNNPLVAGALRRTDCSPISDGAAAVVLVTDDAARDARRRIGFRSRVQVNDFLPMSRRDMTRFEGAERAWATGLNEAGLTLEELDLVETHDCFTIAELIQYESMGLTPRGEGYRAVLEGWTRKDGRLPVNPSGGLKAKGHPVGATGVSMHVMAAKQLAGEADGMQIPGAGLAAVFNMGGSAVSNYLSILELERA
ncbi:acetyl-CoA acetyltransferase [Ectothiorhodospiraceae bacterium WFHF3C12]|nr:acetyl-CoA acetyltransferase [Ectothiorhodospiraceae bacterium WFHF3C12]